MSAIRDIFLRGRWMGLAALVSLGCTVTVPLNSQETSMQKCGPPVYCARTDRQREPYPKTPPALGLAGSIITDPSFHSRILRVTDAKSDPDGLGRPMMSPASAETNAWNADGTKFYVLTPGGQFVLYDFDEAEMKARQKGVMPVTEGDFSHTNRTSCISRDVVIRPFNNTTFPMVSSRCFTKSPIA